MQKKKILIPLICAILIIVGLCGFINKPSKLDEHDHGKNIIASSSWHILKSGETYYPAGCKCLCVDCNCKYIEINWNVYGNGTEDCPLNRIEEERLYLNIILPDLSIRYNYYEFNTSSAMDAIRLNTTYPWRWGNWKIYFSNSAENPEIHMDYSISKIL